MERFKVCIAGAGLIGSGLGVNALTHGFPVAMWVFADWEIELCKKRVGEMLDTLEKNEAITAQEKADALSRVSYTTDLKEAVTGSGFIIEGGPENTEVKRKFYAQIEEYCEPDVVISSTTTAKLPSQLQEGAKHPERILVGHPYNPAYLLPLVEICGGKQTEEKYIQYAVKFFEEIGKVAPICRKEISGYIVNRVNWAVSDEAQKTVRDGVCTVEDMDKAIIYGPGLRFAITGQLLTLSLGVEGGFRKMEEKYGSPIQDAEKIAQGVDDEMAHRDPAIGNDPDSISAYRDSMIIKMLKLHGLM